LPARAHHLSHSSEAATAIGPLLQRVASACKWRPICAQQRRGRQAVHAVAPNTRAANCGVRTLTDCNRECLKSVSPRPDQPAEFPGTSLPAIQETRSCSRSRACWHGLVRHLRRDRPALLCRNIVDQKKSRGALVEGGEHRSESPSSRLRFCATHGHGTGGSTRRSSPSSQPH
jgi:hypothetical protein